MTGPVVDRLCKTAPARPLVGLVIALVGWTCRPTAAAAPEPTPSLAVLELPGDGFATGQFGAVPEPAGGTPPTLIWKSAAFAQPFELAWSSISRVRLAPAAPPAVPANAWRVDLASGGVVIGGLEGVDAEHVTLLVPSLGAAPLQLRRDAIVRLTREGSQIRVLVPGAIGAWKGDRKAWREEGGRLAGSDAGGGLCRDVAAPARACFDIGIAWDERPEFEIEAAAGPLRMAALEKAGEAANKSASAEESYRIEAAAEGELLVVREGDRTAQMAIGARIPAGPGRLWLRVFVDQQTGRLAVTLPQAADGGRPVADQTLAPTKQAVQTGLGIRLRRGRLRIDRLRVRPWTEPEPRLVDTVGLGSSTAELESFDKAGGSFVVRKAEEQRQVPAQDVTEIALRAEEPPTRPAEGVLVGFHDGTLLAGRVLDIAPPVIRIEFAGVSEPVRCDLGRIAVLENLAPVTVTDLAGRPGLLEGPGISMPGCLANAAGAAGLGWQARAARAANPLAGSTAPLRVVYVADADAAAPADASAAGTGPVPGMGRHPQVHVGPGTPVPVPPPPTPFPGGQSLLILKTGDAVLCTVLSIDDTGVRIKKDAARELVVPHAAMRAIELVAAAGQPLSKTKADRLLMLPRAQQADPPTHLLRLPGGDYMRGKVLALDDTTVRFEVAGSIKELRRADVTRLIWLAVAGDAADAAAVAAIAADRKPADVIVRATMRGQEGLRRLTCLADRVSGNTLGGRSGVLGDVTVDLTHCTALDIGSAATAVVSGIPYAQWRLKPAPVPRALQESK